MSEPIFTATDSATWPALLTIDQIAAIVQRKIYGLRKSLQQRTFQPAPMKVPGTMKLVRPYRWRKVDVLRHVEGARGSSLRRSA